MAYEIIADTYYAYPTDEPCLFCDRPDEHTHADIPFPVCDEGCCVGGYDPAEEVTGGPEAVRPMFEILTPDLDPEVFTYYPDVYRPAPAQWINDHARMIEKRFILLLRADIDPDGPAGRQYRHARRVRRQRRAPRRAYLLRKYGVSW